MARFGRSGDRKGSGSKQGFTGRDRNRRGNRDGQRFGDDSDDGNRRDSGRMSRRNSGRGDFGGGFGRNRNNRRPRRELEFTKVTCSSCGNECEVPFKPTSDKPVYCRDCFGKKGGGGSSSSNYSGKELEKINEKLDKIMKALDIE